MNTINILEILRMTAKDFWSRKSGKQHIVSIYNQRHASIEIVNIYIYIWLIYKYIKWLMIHTSRLKLAMPGGAMFGAPGCWGNAYIEIEMILRSLLRNFSKCIFVVGGHWWMELLAEKLPYWFITQMIWFFKQNEEFQVIWRNCYS